MLRKLIKYDMRYIGRIVPWVYLSAIAVALLMSLLLFLTSLEPELAFLAGITALPYFLVIGIISISGFIMIAIRVYKNLYSDEGYLTFTLPVTMKQQILSKVFSGAIWEFLGFIVALICIALPLLTVWFAYSDMQETIKYIVDYLWFSLKSIPTEYMIRVIALVVTYAAMIVIALFMNPITLLLSCSIGQFAKKNRVLLSIGAYFGITFALSSIGSIVSTIVVMLAMTGSAVVSGPETTTMMLDAYIWAFAAMDMIYIVYYIASYFGVKKIMTHKLNLV